MIDWASDTFKALIAAAALWVSAYCRKQAIPLLNSIKKLSVVVNRVDDLELKVSIIDSRALALIETDANPIFVTDVDGNLIHANIEWLELTGFTDLDHAKGKGYMEAIPDDYIVPLEKILKRHSKHETSFECVLIFQHIKTKVRNTRLCRSEPIHDKNKVLLGSIGRLYKII